MAGPHPRRHPSGTCPPVDIARTEGRVKVTAGPPAARQPERRFPDDIWRAAVGDPTEIDACLQSAAAAAVKRRGAPVDLDLARRHLAPRLTPGAYWIYACSSDSQSVVDLLEADPQIRILGFIDKNADSLGRFLGRPVVTPAAALAVDFDRILAAHAHYELDFIDFLKEQKVPEARLVRVYTDPGYRQAAVTAYARRAVAVIGAGIRNVIVTDSVVVVSDDELLSVFDQEETVAIYYGSTDIEYATKFKLIDVRRSLQLMMDVLSNINPVNIYIRTFFDEACLVSTVRRRFPNARLIHELFDMALVFPDEVLRKWNKWDDDKIRLLRWTERESFRTSDFIVSKRGGKAWEQITAPFGVANGTAFSRVVVPERDVDAVSSAQEPIKIIYAGYLPPDPGHVGGYYNLYPCFENLTATGDIVVDIYNAGHYKVIDHLYKIYLERDDGDRINYHRALAYDDLIEKIKYSHFGWLYNERSEIYIHDAAVTIPGRVTGYLSAGIPVIIDDEFEFLAGLVAEFNAGIVVPDGRGDLIPQLIRAADYKALRRGARRLRAHMADCNDNLLRRLRELIKR